MVYINFMKANPDNFRAIRIGKETSFEIEETNIY